MGAPSPATWRRIGRFGVPIAAALATVVIGAQGASATTLTSTHPVPPPRCSGGPHLSTSTPGSGGVVVTQPAKPGKPGKPGKCVVCVVTIKGHGGTGPVTKVGGSGTATTGASGSGTVTTGPGKGGVVTIGRGGTVSVCPARPGEPRLTH